MVVGRQSTSNVIAVEVAKPEQELVPPVMFAVTTTLEMTETSERKMEHRRALATIVAVSGDSPDVVSGGEKAMKPVMPLQRTLPVAVTGAGPLVQLPSAASAGIPNPTRANLIHMRRMKEIPLFLTIRLEAQRIARRLIEIWSLSEPRQSAYQQRCHRDCADVFPGQCLSARPLSVTHRVPYPI